VLAALERARPATLEHARLLSRAPRGAERRNALSSALRVLLSQQISIDAGVDVNGRLHAAAGTTIGRTVRAGTYHSVPGPSYRWTDGPHVLGLDPRPTALVADPPADDVIEVLIPLEQPATAGAVTADVGALLLVPIGSLAIVGGGVGLRCRLIVPAGGAGAVIVP
jgi:hypothetical protein